MWPYLGGGEGKASNKTSESTQTLDLEDKTMKTVVINTHMFEELKESLSKELKEKIMRTISHQLKNINNKEIMELKNTITEIKNSLQGLNSRFRMGRKDKWRLIFKIYQ